MRSMLAALAVSAIVVGTVAGCAEDGSDSDSAATQAQASSRTTAEHVTPTTTQVMPAGTNCSYPAARPASKPVNPPPAAREGNAPVSVTMQTGQGDIGLVLDNSASPCTTNSFVSLVQQGFYDQTRCHRLTTAQSLSVLQCGDPSGTGSGGPGYRFADEYPANQYSASDPAGKTPIVYKRGTVAMANAGPGTNGSQFFLVYRDSYLPPAYTIFGTIDEDGLQVLDRVAAAGVSGRAASDGAPVLPVEIANVGLN